jgi:endoglucanase
VRATGGRNAYRYLAVQGFNTNIDHTVNFATIPKDTTPNRLLMEVHFYDPFNFTLAEANTITQWGAHATDPSRTEAWANEAFIDAQFQKMKTNFIDKGVGVILGEYGAISRTDVPGHEAFRLYWVQYVSNSARSHKLVPVWWDAGVPQNNHSMGLFNRTTGQVVYPNLRNAILP